MDENVQRFIYLLILQDFSFVFDSAVILPEAVSFSTNIHFFFRGQRTGHYGLPDENNNATKFNFCRNIFCSISA